MSYNRATLVGNLGRDPDVRKMPSGDSVCNFSIATSERWKDKQTGEQKEATEWHNIVIFGKLAEIAGRYLEKGSKALIEGKLKTRKWQDQSGQDRYTTEIVVSGFDGKLVMLGRPGDSSGRSSSASTGSSRSTSRDDSGGSYGGGSKPDYSGLDDGFDDEIPF